MAQYSSSLAAYGAYAFDKQSIADIWNACAKFINANGKSKRSEISFSIKFHDEHSVKADNADDALRDAYVNTKYIESVGIEGLSFDEDVTRHVSVTIRSEDFLPLVDVTIRGDRDGCNLARKDIEEIVQAKRLWYAPLVPKPNSAPWLIIFIGGALSLFVLAAIAHTLLTPKLQKDAIGTILTVEMIVALACIGFLRKKLFPKMVFDFGQSASRGNAAQVWRTIVLVGVGLAFVIGVAASVVATKIAG